MKQIIEYMGSTIIAILIAWCVLGVFYGLPVELEKIANEPFVVPLLPSEENQAFIDYQTIPRDRIWLKDHYVIRTGITYEVDDFFTGLNGVVDSEIWFVAGWNESLPEVTIQLMDDGKKFLFTQAGIYQVLVSYKDPENEIYETQIRLIVNAEEVV